MKKPLLSTLFVLASLGASAQISSGTRLREVSGTVQNQLILPKEGGVTASTVFSSSYKWGRVVKDNVIHGWTLSPGIGIAASGNDKRDKTVYWMPSLSVGYFARRYFPLTEGLYLFGEAGAGATALLTLKEGEKPSIQQYSLTGTFSAGVTYLTKSNWGLTFSSGIAAARLNHFRYPQNTASTSLNLVGGTDAATFTIGVTKFVGGEVAPTTLFSPKKESIYRTGQRFLSGDIAIAAPLDGDPYHSVSLGYSNLRFRSPLTAGGYSLSGRFSITDQQISGQSARIYLWGAGLGLVREKYLPIAPKLSLLARAGLYFNYTGHTQEQRTSVTEQSHQLDFTPGLSPGIQYQLTEKWAVTAFVGSLSLGNAAVSYTLYPDSETGYGNYFSTKIGFAPAYSISNSGISFRYFPGK